MSAELLNALKELRSDPDVAGILSANKPQQNSPPGTVRTPRSFAKSPASAGSQPVKLTEDALEAATADISSFIHSAKQAEPELSPTDQLRHRQTEREEVGVNNWLQRHRDEVSNSETKRLQNRLRAEHLFASSRLDFETFKVEHEASMSHLHAVEEGGEIGDDTEGKSTSSPPPVPFSPNLNRYRSYPEEGTSKSEDHFNAKTSAAQTDDMLVDPSFQSNLVATMNPKLASYDGEYVVSSSAKAAKPAPALKTDDQLGPLDAEENYLRKQKELFGVATTVEGAPPSAAKSAALDEVVPATPAHSQIPSAAAMSSISGRRDVPVPSPSPFGTASSPQRFNAAAFSQKTGDVEALMEAVRQRDATILRLERQLREDRDYFEGQLAKQKQETEQAKALGDSRVAALRGQIDQLMMQQRRTNDISTDDINVKITHIQHIYERNVTDLRQQTMHALDTFHNEAEKKVRGICDRAEAAIRAAKEQYRVERTDIIGKEKEKLIERISHEQNVLLREAELQLRNNVEASLLTKLKYELERGLRSQMKTELLPLVNKQLVSEVRANIAQGMRGEVESLFADQHKKMERELETNMEESAKRFVEDLAHKQRVMTDKATKAAADAAAASAKSSHGNEGDKSRDQAAANPIIVDDDVDHIGVNVLHNQLNEFSKLMAEVEREHETQKDLEVQHKADMALQEGKMQALEAALKKEEAISQMIANQMTEQQRNTKLSLSSSSPVSPPGMPQLRQEESTANNIVPHPLASPAPKPHVSFAPSAGHNTSTAQPNSSRRTSASVGAISAASTDSTPPPPPPHPDDIPPPL